MYPSVAIHHSLAWGSLDLTQSPFQGREARPPNVPNLGQLSSCFFLPTPALPKPLHPLAIESLPHEALSGLLNPQTIARPRGQRLHHGLRSHDSAKPGWPAGPFDERHEHHQSHCIALPQPSTHHDPLVPGIYIRQYIHIFCQRSQWRKGGQRDGRCGRACRPYVGAFGKPTRKSGRCISVSEEMLELAEQDQIVQVARSLAIKTQR